MSEQCWADTHINHLLIFVLPSLLFWMFIYPLFVFVQMFTNHRNFKNKFQKRDSVFVRSMRKFSFFTDGVKEKFFYWEILLMLRKYCFIFLSIFSFSNQNITFNLCSMSALIFLTLCIQIIKQPFEYKLSDGFFLCSNSLILITIFGFISLMMNNSNLNQIVLFLLIIILNVLLFIKWGHDLYELNKIDLTKKLKEFQNKFKLIFKPFMKNKYILRIKAPFGNSISIQIKKPTLKENSVTKK